MVVSSEYEMRRKQTYFHFFLLTLQILLFVFLSYTFCTYTWDIVCSFLIARLPPVAPLWHRCSRIYIFTTTMGFLFQIGKGESFRWFFCEEKKYFCANHHFAATFAEWVNYEKALFTTEIIKIIQIITMIKFNFLQNIKLQ